MRRNIKIKQRDVSDCGAVCLASIAACYKLQIPISKIRQYAGTDKRGTNVLGLTEAADRIGFQCKAAKGSLDNLSRIPLPAIAHLKQENQLQHYVVIYKSAKKYVLIMDPADGRLHKRSREEFQKEWTGILVLLIPDDNYFVKGKQSISNVKRFWDLIKPHTGITIQALIGSLVYTILGLSSTVYIQKIVDLVLVDGNIRLLNLLSVAMIVLLVFQCLIGYFKSLFALQVGQHIDARLILGYYKHLLKLPQRFFDSMRVGEIISRVSDAVKIRAFINDVALSIIINTFVIGFSVSLMFIYNWKLALVMLSIIPVYSVIFLISNYINKRNQRTLMENAAELETQLVEGLNAAGTIKRFGMEEHANGKIEHRFTALLQSVYRSGVSGLFIGNASEFITRLFVIILLWAGSYFVINRSLSLGELLSFYALTGYFTGPCIQIIGANKNIHDALIAADRLFEIIDLETEDVNENKVELTRAILGDIELNNVSFRYGTRIQVFENLSLKIKKGSNTGIVGESGSGKSTLLSLLQNLYPLNGGTVTIGGIDMQHINTKSLRKMIGVVPQQIDLFAGTIVENIAIGDYEPDMQRILTLSQLVGINEFIQKLPNTYKTILSEQGINLSGGQRQGLAIARAMYHDPEILILDEATSNLDAAIEKRLKNVLDLYKKQGRTVIIIAHRLITVKDCDTILVLNSGSLVEEGNHQELIGRDGNYARLWKYYAGIG